MVVRPDLRFQTIQKRVRLVLQVINHPDFAIPVLVHPERNSVQIIDVIFDADLNDVSDPRLPVSR